MPTFAEYLENLIKNPEEPAKAHITDSIEKFANGGESGSLSRLFQSAPIQEEMISPFVKLYQEILLNMEMHPTKENTLSTNTNMLASKYVNEIYQSAIKELFNEPGKTKIMEALHLDKAIDDRANKLGKSRLHVTTEIKQQLLGAYILLIQEQVVSASMNYIFEITKDNGKSICYPFVGHVIENKRQLFLESFRLESDKHKKSKKLEAAEEAVSTSSDSMIAEIIEPLSKSISQAKMLADTPEEKLFVIEIEELERALMDEKGLQKRLSIIDEFNEKHGSLGIKTQGLLHLGLQDTIANLEGVLRLTAELPINKQPGTPSRIQLNAPPSPPEKISTVTSQTRMDSPNKITILVDIIDFLSEKLGLKTKMAANDTLRVVENKKNHSMKVNILSQDRRRSLDEFVVQKDKVTSSSSNPETYKAMLDVAIMAGKEGTSIEVWASNRRALLAMADKAREKGFHVARMRLGDQNGKVVSEEELRGKPLGDRATTIRRGP